MEKAIIGAVGRGVFGGIVAGLLLIACSQTQGGQHCQVSNPIYVTPADAAVISDRLVADLNAHNETGAALCGWKP